MLRYTFNRILMMIPTLLGVAVLVFFMLRVIPGDVVEVKLRGDGGNVSQATLDMERHRLGLDKPLLYQFKDWMVGLATLDLGKSMWTDRPVVEEIATRLELSLQVAIMASIFAVLLAIPLGTTAALMRGTWVDYAVRIITIGGGEMAGLYRRQMTALGGERRIRFEERRLDDQRIGAADRRDQRFDLLRIADYRKTDPGCGRAHYRFGLDPAAVG